MDTDMDTDTDTDTEKEILKQRDTVGDTAIYICTREKVCVYKSACVCVVRIVT